MYNNLVMRMSKRRVIARSSAITLMLIILTLFSGCATRSIGEPFVTGLNQPRGMTFDAHGNLLVTEAGALDTKADGSLVTPTNHSGQLLRITPNREITTIATELPLTDLGAHGQVGLADVAVMDDAIYVLTGEGYDMLSRSVLRVGVPGPPQPVASIRNFAAAGLPQDLAETALVAANPYAMVAAPDRSALYVADGASGRVLRVKTDGAIKVFAEIRTMPPFTGLTFGPDGRLYVAMFSMHPHAPGSGQIEAIDASGTLAVVAKDVTMPIDVGFDAAGALYVLEFDDGLQPNQPYIKANGRLLRITPDGKRTVILDQLDHPTAMVFSSTGDLYIALGGAFSPLHQGSILKISCLDLDDPDVCSEHKHETR